MLSGRESDQLASNNPLGRRQPRTDRIHSSRWVSAAQTVRRSVRRRVLARKGWQVKSVLNSLMNLMIENRAGDRVGRPAATSEVIEVSVSASRCC